MPIKERVPDSSWRCQSKRMSGNRHKLQKEKVPHSKDEQTLEQAAWKGRGYSILGGFQNSISPELKLASL